MGKHRSLRGLSIGSWRFRPTLLPTVAVVVVLGLLLRLGHWQWGRAEEKDELQREFTLRAADSPIQISPSLGPTSPVSDEALASLRHARAIAIGTYDTRHQYLLDNRVHEGVAGYHVLTALRLDDGVSAVLVNRGWLPVGPNRAIRPEIPTPEAPVTVEGLMSPPSPGGLLLGDSGYEAGGWPRVVQRVELDRMRSQLDLALHPLILLLESDQADGFVRDWRPYYGISPDRHRAYAFQWWSLAVALVVIYVVVNLSRSDRG